MFFRSITCALAHHGYITSMVNGLITLMTPSTRPHPWTTDYLSLPWTGRDSNHGPIGPESYTLPVRHNFTDKRVDIHRLVDCPHTTPAAVNCFRAPVICFDRGWLRSEWHWLITSSSSSSNRFVIYTEACARSRRRLPWRSQTLGRASDERGGLQSAVLYCRSPCIPV